MKDQPLTIRATLDPAPEALAPLLTLRCVQGADEALEQNGAPPSVEVQFPAVTGEINCRAAAMTKARAPLFGARAQFAPPGEEGSVMPMTSAADAAEEDDGGSAWPWIIGGGVLVAGATVAAILLLAPKDEKVSFDEVMVNW